MKSVLVTGAGGLIGSRVAPAAQEAGYDVIRIFHKSPVPEAANVLQRDLRVPLENVPPVASIFHLAGGYAGAGARALQHADLEIARNVLRWGVDQGVQNWVFSSAAEVYGRVSGPATEATATRPVIPYGRVKLAIEQLFVEMAKERPDCRIAILRIGEVYGSESRLLRELGKRLQRGFCPLPGTGRVPVSFVHVDDVALAFLLAAQCAPRGVSIYNVADDEAATWRSFVRYYADVLGTRPPVPLPLPLVYGYMLAHQVASRIAGSGPLLTRQAIRLLTTPKALSNAKIKRELGFEPTLPNFRHGLEMTVHGLSHHAQNGAAQGSTARQITQDRDPHFR